MFRTLFWASVLTAFLHWRAGAQEIGCDATFSDTEAASLIASNYASSGGATSTVQLQTSPDGFSLRVVCLSSYGVRDRYRFVSLVAYFSLNGGVPQYGQFEFECVNAAWSANSPFLSTSTTRRAILAADALAISAAPRTDCAYCLNNLYYTDPVNHCYACSGCRLPLCFLSKGQSPATAVITCCNAYLQNGTCSAQCPSSYSIGGNQICEYNVFDSTYGPLVAVGIALGVGVFVGLCCCLFFTCVCFSVKTVHERKQRPVVRRSPTLASDDKVVFSDLM